MPVQTFSTSELPSGAANWQVARRLVGAFAPHAQAMPDMSVQLDAGHLLNGTVLTEVLSQTVGPFALPLGRRVDRIVIDRGTGAASVVIGTEGSPLPPAIPAGTFPVARVRLSADMTAITNERIDDERALSDLATAAALTPAGEAEAGIAELATQAEVDAGADDARIVTPLKAAARYATKAAASESAAGLIELATQAETDAGTDDQRALTPLKAAGRYATKALASTASAGLAQIATQAEVDAGTDAAKVVTPLTAAARYATKAVASETSAGLVEIATQAEVDAGTDDSRVLTPLKAASRYATKAAASETAPGLVELATQAEVDAGLDDQRALTPLKAAGRYATKAAATTGAAGLAQIATQAEVDAGTDAAKMVTPLTAAARYATKAAASETSAGLVELATAAEVQAGTDAVRAVTPAGLKGVTDTLLRKAGDSLGGDVDAAGHSVYGEALRSAAKTVDGSGSPHVVTVDFRTGDGAAHTATANTRLTPQFPTGGGIGYLDLSNGGAFTVTFATGARFVGGTAPSFTTSGLDRVWFMGTTGNYTVTVQKGIA